MLFPWIRIGILFCPLLAWAQPSQPSLHSQSDHPETALFQYFEAQVKQIESTTLSDVQSLDEWATQKETRRRELLDMLGLWPFPERTELNPKITGKVEHEEFVVENLHFQSFPGLFVTANLYLPKNLAKPAPTILYVSGHANMQTNTIRLGNKTGYQHHGAWFARHGYVCLVIDTIQLGEIPGEHHGTYRLGHWWWNSRGFTPAGVEAWTSIRALDYLGTRNEVDDQRIGMTGRSGGGSYTWTTAAIDERVKVAAPVAGMTDLRNHVLDGVVEGHCDCMYFINTYRWDFAINAALIAPRPLLIVNTDSDPIFPLDGVYRVFEQTRRIYHLYGKEQDLGLVVAPGPHKDTQDLQVPVFRWFDKYLKEVADPVVSVPAQPQFAPIQLRVLKSVPEDASHESVPRRFGPLTYPDAHSELARAEAGSIQELRNRLQARTFAGWPDSDSDGIGQVREVASRTMDGVRFLKLEVQTQSHVRVPMLLAYAAEGSGSGADTRKQVELEILDSASWKDWQSQWGPLFGLNTGTEIAAVSKEGETWKRLVDGELVQAWFLPRGIGPTEWSGDLRRKTQIRRRFQLLGQTVGGMQVWDVLQGIQSLRHVVEGLDAAGSDLSVNRVTATGEQACHLLYATLFVTEPKGLRLRLHALPMSHYPDGPDYLNVLQISDIPQVLTWVQRQIPVEVLP